MPDRGAALSLPMATKLLKDAADLLREFGIRAIEILLADFTHRKVELKVFNGAERTLF
jgi:hypothetical protein